MKDRLIDAIAQAHPADLGEVLAGYSRDRLKELCRALGLPDGGKEKAAIVQRLLAPEEEEEEEKEKESGAGQPAAPAGRGAAAAKPRASGNGKSNGKSDEPAGDLLRGQGDPRSGPWTTART